jgi:hypothetical protein
MVIVVLGSESIAHRSTRHGHAGDSQHRRDFESRMGQLGHWHKTTAIRNGFRDCRRVPVSTTR